MIHQTVEEVRIAARDGEGFCLHCGARADWPELHPHPIVLCEECDRYDVLSAVDVLRVLELVEDTE